MAAALLRAFATTVVLVALHYVVPLDRLPSVPAAVTFTAALAILLATTAWQLRRVLVSANPAIAEYPGTHRRVRAGGHRLRGRVCHPDRKGDYQAFRKGIDAGRLMAQPGV